MRLILFMALAILASCSSNKGAGGGAAVASWEVENAPKGYRKVQIYSHHHLWENFDGRNSDGTLTFFKSEDYGHDQEGKAAIHIHKTAKRFKRQGGGGIEFYDGSRVENAYLKAPSERGGKIRYGATGTLKESVVDGYEVHSILAADASLFRSIANIYRNLKQSAYRTEAVRHGQGGPSDNPMPITNVKGAEADFSSSDRFYNVKRIAHLAHSKDRSNR